MLSPILQEILGGFVLGLFVWCATFTIIVLGILYFKDIWCDLGYCPFEINHHNLQKEHSEDTGSSSLETCEWLNELIKKWIFDRKGPILAILDRFINEQLSSSLLTRIHSKTTHSRFYLNSLQLTKVTWAKDPPRIKSIKTKFGSNSPLLIVFELEEDGCMTNILERIESEAIISYARNRLRLNLSNIGFGKAKVMIKFSQSTISWPAISVSLMPGMETLYNTPSTNSSPSASPLISRQNISQPLLMPRFQADLSLWSGLGGSNRYMSQMLTAYIQAQLASYLAFPNRIKIIFGEGPIYSDHLILDVFKKLSSPLVSYSPIAMVIPCRGSLILGLGSEIASTGTGKILHFIIFDGHFDPKSFGKDALSVYCTVQCGNESGGRTFSAIAAASETVIWNYRGSFAFDQQSSASLSSSSLSIVSSNASNSQLLTVRVFHRRRIGTSVLLSEGSIDLDKHVRFNVYESFRLGGIRLGLYYHNPIYNSFEEERNFVDGKSSKNYQRSLQAIPIAPTWATLEAELLKESSLQINNADERTGSDQHSKSPQLVLGESLLSVSQQQRILIEISWLIEWIPKMINLKTDHHQSQNNCILFLLQALQQEMVKLPDWKLIDKWVSFITKIVDEPIALERLKNLLSGDPLDRRRMQGYYNRSATKEIARRRKSLQNISISYGSFCKVFGTILCNLSISSAGLALEGFLENEIFAMENISFFELSSVPGIMSDRARMINFLDGLPTLQQRKIVLSYDKAERCIFFKDPQTLSFQNTMVLSLLAHVRSLQILNFSPKHAVLVLEVGIGERITRRAFYHNNAETVRTCFAILSSSLIWPIQKKQDSIKHLSSENIQWNAIRRVQLLQNNSMVIEIQHSEDLESTQFLFSEFKGGGLDAEELYLLLKACLIKDHVIERHDSTLAEDFCTICSKRSLSFESRLVTDAFGIIVDETYYDFSCSFLRRGGLYTGKIFLFHSALSSLGYFCFNGRRNALKSAKITIPFEKISKIDMSTRLLFARGIEITVSNNDADLKTYEDETFFLLGFKKDLTGSLERCYAVLKEFYRKRELCQ